MSETHHSVEFESTIGKIFGEIIGFIIAVIVLVVLPRFKFITDSYSVWMPVGLITAAISAIVKIIAALIKNKSVQTVAEIISILVSGVSIWVLRVFFPFDFSRVGLDFLNQLMNFSLLLVLVALSIALVVNFVKLAVGGSTFSQNVAQKKED